MSEEWVDRDVGRWSGKACVKGTRIPVFILAGLSVEEIRCRWPYLSDEQISLALDYVEAHQGRVKRDARGYKRECRRLRMNADRTDE